ncbi:MAG: MFS transporter, partial [Fimbriimonadaceae bacterium]
MSQPRPLTAAFLTVLFDLLSFSLMIPDIQPRLDSKGYPGALIGFTIAAYSISQLLFGAPLGRWSDRVGRRKTLLITTGFSVFAAALYALSDNLGWMIASRVLLGIAGANLGVAYAYVSDVTEPSKRASAMGKLGMAFGIGFMFGPIIGAVLVQAGAGSPVLLAGASTFMAIVNFVFVLLFLPDVPPIQESSETSGLNPARKLIKALRTPGLGTLLVLFFVANFAFANLESTFFRLLMSRLNLNHTEVAIPGAAILVFVGIIAAAVQGGVVGKLVARFGELRLMRVGYMIQSPALAVIPFIPFWVPFLIGALILGFGSGISSPSLTSLISRTAPKGMAGGIFGVTQSLGALARVVSPVIGISLFDVGSWVPYALAGFLLLTPLILALRFKES